MSNDQSNQPYGAGYGPQDGPAYGQGYRQAGYGPQHGPGYGWQYGPQNGPQYGPQQGPGAERRVDLLDVLEGVMRDGFSLSNVTRIARASGSNFWLGAAIGAGAVVLARRPEVRAAVGDVFKRHGPKGHGSSR